MQQNIGTVDRYLRLSSGVLILAGGLQMRQSSLGKTALLTLGAMKIAEGVTGWCPMLYAFGVQTIEQPSQASANSASQGESSQARQKTSETQSKAHSQESNPSSHSTSTEEHHHPNHGQKHQHHYASHQHSSQNQPGAEENEGHVSKDSDEHSRHHEKSFENMEKDVLYS